MFSESFLDDLRARVSVSEVVRRHGCDLNRAGAEWKCLSPFAKENTPSFTVNDAKGFYHCFSTGKHGDVFAFLVEKEGLSFPEAVRRVCDLAGVPCEERGKDSFPNRSGNKESSTEAREGGARFGMDGSGPSTDNEGRRDITATFDYTDADDVLVYQVCRVEWTENGKRKKTFFQRRPVEGRPRTEWAWGLSVGEYVQSRKGDWYRVLGDREKWEGARVTLEEVPHTLYRITEVLAELRHDPDERRTIFLPEGERKVECHRDWGMIATCNSGGARHWVETFSEYLRGADVVIEADNDQAGREGAHKKARSLKGVAARVRLLEWGKVWPGCPEKGDIVDFIRAGGTRDRFLELVDLVPDWTEPPFISKFGLVMWAGQDAREEDEYDFLIEDLVPDAEAVLIYGETQSGKSFFTFDMAMAVARGLPFFGRKVLRPAGIVYCAYEAGKGFKNRMRAYRRAFGIDLVEIPFGVLTTPVNLWSDKANVDHLIDEIQKLARVYFDGLRIGAVVIDTHNAATPGASEIDSEVVSTIRDRYRKIIRETGGGVWIVSHKNASGRHRGNEQLYNNIDTAIDIAVKTDGERKGAKAILDNLGRPIRAAEVKKQREGIQGHLCDFVLNVVESGTVNRFGKPRTSCVVGPPAREGEPYDVPGSRFAAIKGAVRLTDNDAVFFRALLKALDDCGVPPPASLGLPVSVTRVVTNLDVGKIYRDLVPNDETTDEAKSRYEERSKKRMQTSRTKLFNFRVIGTLQGQGDNAGKWYLWPTGRRVSGPGLIWPPVTRDMREKDETPVDDATGRPIVELF